MTKQFGMFFINMLKLMGIMYISISLKNILQILLGTIFNNHGIPEVFTTINLRREPNIETTKLLLQAFFIYDFFIFVFLAYIWIFLILYIFVSIFGNKLWLHIIYAVVVYLATVLFFDHFYPSFLFILIVVILGYANWWMFGKWIKF